MNRFRKLMALVLAGVVTLQLSARILSDEPITFDELPHKAKVLILGYFANVTVTRASYDAKVTDRNYEVALSDNTLISFDELGNWTEIRCADVAVPVDLVPRAIAEYVDGHFAGTDVQKMERGENCFRVTLSNHEEIAFDAEGNSLGAIADLSGVTEE